MIALGTYLKTYRVGDIVDVKANGAVQKGVSKSAHSSTLCPSMDFRINPTKNTPNVWEQAG